MYLQEKVKGKDLTPKVLGETGSFEQRFSRSLEQFLSDPQLLNSYSYAKNNPLTLLDPTGAAPAVPATQYLPPFHQVLMTSQFNVGMAMMKYGLMYSTAMDIETVTDNEQSTANRVIAGVSLGTMFLGGEVSGATKGIQGARAVAGAADNVLGAVAKGQAGERASGIVKNTTRIPSITGTAQYRIPDALDQTTRAIGEVKNVSRQALTQQMHDFIGYAKQTQSHLTLFVRENTHLSKPLQQGLKGIGATVKRLLPK